MLPAVSNLAYISYHNFFISLFICYILSWLKKYELIRCLNLSDQIMASAGGFRGLTASCSSNTSLCPALSSGAALARNILNAARVIPPTDNEKKPLWRYVELLQKTGNGVGRNARSRCRLYDHIIYGSYSRVKVHLLKIGNYGVKFCPKLQSMCLLNFMMKLLKRRQ